jgi:hypothetical protein
MVAAATAILKDIDLSNTSHPRPHRPAIKSDQIRQAAGLPSNINGDR